MVLGSEQVKDFETHVWWPENVYKEFHAGRQNGFQGSWFDSFIMLFIILIRYYSCCIIVGSGFFVIYNNIIIILRAKEWPIFCQIHLIWYATYFINTTSSDPLKCYIEVIIFSAQLSISQEFVYSCLTIC